jgi:MYXO-CTERM domain-containing protein
MRASLLVLICFLPLAAPAAVTLTAVADGDVEDLITPGYAVDSTDVKVGTVAADKRGIYEFDLSSLPTGSVITGATLKLMLNSQISNVGAVPATITFSGFTGNGTIEAADYYTGATQLAQETYPTDATRAPIGTLLSIALTDLTAVQAASDSAGRYLGIRSSTTQTGVTFSVRSLENTTSGSVAPTLELEFASAPEPSLTVLGMVGMAALGMRRRRARGLIPS